MIKAVLVLNMQGNIRLAYFYEGAVRTGGQDLISSIYKAVAKRGEEASNIISFASWPTPDTHLIYRKYSTLFVIFIVDGSESQLAVLDLIQSLVEVLNMHFGSICELDFMFHSDKVINILSEMIMGGLVLETDKDAILNSVKEAQKFENKSTDGKIKSIQPPSTTGYC